MRKGRKDGKLSFSEPRRRRATPHYSYLPMTWRLLLSPPLDGPANMALDEALMERARRTRETVLRVYAWTEPTLSLGRNQRALGHYDLGRLREEGIVPVRRPTGGRALLHHREVTYSVTAPVVAGEGIGVVYERVNALLLRALEGLGVSAALAAGHRTSAPGVMPCFAEPAPGELVVEGRKLVGSAQWRDAGALLQHGSILLEDDQSRIPSLLSAEGRARLGRQPALPPATLREVLARRPAIEEVAGALFDAVRAGADTHASELHPDAPLLHDAAARAGHFRDPAWTWRR
jgi:lipoyl(octanoyl) transferase